MPAMTTQLSYWEIMAEIWVERESNGKNFAKIGESSAVRTIAKTAASMRWTIPPSPPRGERRYKSRGKAATSAMKTPASIKSSGTFVRKLEIQVANGLPHIS